MIAYRSLLYSTTVLYDYQAKNNNKQECMHWNSMECNDFGAMHSHLYAITQLCLCR